MYWTDTPDGHFCTRHENAFERGEVCHQCIADPPPEIAGAERDEEEVASLRARVHEYRSNSRTCLKASKELREAGTTSESNLAVKWNDCAIKWARLAEEQQARLDGYVRDDRLLRREREMAGVRGSH